MGPPTKTESKKVKPRKEEDHELQNKTGNDLTGSKHDTENVSSL